MFTTIRLSISVLLLLAVNLLVAQTTTTVAGTVRSAAGELLTGVTVRQKDKTQTVLTDEQGAFTITVSSNDPLIFTYTGFQSTEVKTDKINGPLQIVLQPGDNALEE